MNKNLYVVLMAGGVGVRFWPYSRNSRPKQFLDVLGTGKTLIQSTFERFLPICPPENIFVVTHEEHAAIAREQLPLLKSDQILTEPMRKNTAACIAYASYKIQQLNKEAVIVVTPSDHLILKENEFLDVIKKAADQARADDKLITLGIKPTRPETGYGYIQFHTEKSLPADAKATARQAGLPASAQANAGQAGFAKKVKTFTEKPELSLAKKFLESGDFVWNAGIFIWSVQSIVKAIQLHLPEMAEVFEEIKTKLTTSQEKEAISAAYPQCKSISIDYGVMEKASNVYVCLGDFNWSDLGSWASIHEISDKDKDNNVIQANALTYETRNCMIKGSDNKLIVVQGLNGYLVGEFGNVIIVCEKDREEQFRRFVSDVKSRPNANEFL